MNEPILYQVPTYWLTIAILLLTVLFNYLGWKYGKLRSRKGLNDPSEGLGPAESSLLGLMALILAFTFSLASSKFQTRRELIIEEANDIGTAILRCDLYPDSMRALLRNDFKGYVAARIAYYDAGVDDQKIEQALQQTTHFSNRIWKRIAEYSHNLENRVSSAQMIPAVNSMIDIVTTRESGRLAKTPPLILWMLLVLVFISAFLVGYGQKGKRNPVMIAGFAIMTAVSLYLILELDRPRSGILNLNREERQIIGLMEQLN